MKNFFEVTDTNPEILVKAALTVTVSKTPFFGHIRINGVEVFSGELVEYMLVQHKVGLLSPISLEISLTNKVPEETIEYQRDTAVCVDLEINGYEVLPRFQDRCVYVLEDGSVGPKTHYLGFNGAWSFTIEEPFYRWYHKQMPWGWTV